jgi:hypothetical protein
MEMILILFSMHVMVLVTFLADFVQEVPQIIVLHVTKLQMELMDVPKIILDTLFQEEFANANENIMILFQMQLHALSVAIPVLPALQLIEFVLPVTAQIIHPPMTIHKEMLFLIVDARTDTMMSLQQSVIMSGILIVQPVLLLVELASHLLLIVHLVSENIEI